MPSLTSWISSSAVHLLVVLLMIWAAGKKIEEWAIGTGKVLQQKDLLPTMLIPGNPEESTDTATDPDNEPQPQPTAPDQPLPPQPPQDQPENTSVDAAVDTSEQPEPIDYAGSSGRATDILQNIVEQATDAASEIITEVLDQQQPSPENTAAVESTPEEITPDAQPATTPIPAAPVADIPNTAVPAAAANPVTNPAETTPKPPAQGELFGQLGAEDRAGVEAPRLVILAGPEALDRILEVDAGSVIAEIPLTEQNSPHRYLILSGTLSQPLGWQLLNETDVRPLSQRTLNLSLAPTAPAVAQLSAWGVSRENAARIQIHLRFTNAFDAYLLRIQQQAVQNLPPEQRARVTTTLTIQPNGNGLTATPSVPPLAGGKTMPNPGRQR